MLEGCWSKPLVGLEGTGSAAWVLPTGAGQARHAGRGRRHRAQAGGAVLAPGHHRPGLRARPAVSGPAAERDLANQAELAYRTMIAAWQPSRPTKPRGNAVARYG